MTDRLKGLIVTFMTPMRVDDAEAIINAIELLRHVITVEPILDGYEDQMNRDMIRAELRLELLRVLDNAQSVTK